jgi:hypothetical protein
MCHPNDVRKEHCREEEEKERQNEEMKRKRQNEELKDKTVKGDHSYIWVLPISQPHLALLLGKSLAERRRRRMLLPPASLPR